VNKLVAGGAYREVTDKASYDACWQTVGNSCNTYGEYPHETPVEGPGSNNSSNGETYTGSYATSLGIDWRIAVAVVVAILALIVYFYKK